MTPALREGRLCPGIRVNRPRWAGLACLAALSASARSTASPPPTPALVAPPRWCDLLPRPANAALPRVSVATDWFEVYRAADGVFAIAEPYQFQEVISYLIVGIATTR